MTPDEKRLAVRRRLQRASSALSLILDSNYLTVDELRTAVFAWKAGELQDAEQDVQSIIAEHKTKSKMGCL
jgi:hypothetical protein